MTRRALATALFVCCAFAGLAARNVSGARLTTRLDAPLPEAAPAYTCAQAEKALLEVRPLVEEIAGRKIAHVPRIRLVTRQQATAELDRKPARPGPTPAFTRPFPGCVTRSRSIDRQPDWTDYVRQRPSKHDAAPRKPSAVPVLRRDKRARTRSQISIDYAFGIYNPERETIYLLPGNFKPRLSRAGVPPNCHQAILKMIVAHELTHALQREVTGESIGQNRAKSSSSYSEAARAAIEGHATFVMDRVAKRIGQPQAVAHFHKTIGVGLVLYDDPRHTKANADYRQLERRIYLDGERFIAWHYQRGGNERIHRILRHPPAKWSMIEHPETYSPSPPAPKLPSPPTTKTARGIGPTVPCSLRSAPALAGTRPVVR